MPISRYPMKARIVVVLPPRGITLKSRDGPCC
jgi:hypothetical protein